MPEHPPASLDPRHVALDWLARQRDPLFDDWQAFTEWLEADPSHRTYYQQLAELDAAVADDLAAEPPPSALSEAGPADRPWARRAALAAGVAAALAIVAVTSLRSGGTYDVVTAEGQRKHIVLGDGSRLVLDGATRLRLDSDRLRSAELVTGEVLFDIAHDPDTRFHVAFDGGSVRNLGTRFIVRRAGATTEIAVAKGSVAFDGNAGHAELRPGQRLVVERGKMVQDRVAAGSVGRWATPRLDYDNAPIGTVAADLSRELGVPVSVAPAAANMRISATIQLDLDVEQSMAQLGPLLGVAVRRDGRGWTISSEK